MNHSQDKLGTRQFDFNHFFHIHINILYILN